MRYLLDTNVVSEIRRPRATRQVVEWWNSIPSSDLFLSALVVGEIRRGIERLRARDPTQTAVYELWLQQLREQFDERVLIVDVEIAEEWGRMNATTRVPQFDGLMAATARVHGLVFVTRNITDVAPTHVTVLNPWEWTGA
ncbi:MAG: type II toxin-antitoxin system VapC family toxin [Actinobacteria bacterium]|nr:type II toxin-antitoxin system VapC family toxin [Actinomycetota bacterium]